MGQIRTFIFDCDGTILNTLPDLAEATNKTLSDLGYPTHTEREIVSYIGDGARRLIDRALPQNAPEKEHMRAFEHWCRVYTDLGFTRSEHYPGMKETLERLKAQGCKLGVLSNKIDSATRLVVDQYFPGLFDVVHGERKGIPRKPDPQGLLSTLGDLGADPATTLYAGDAVTDVEVAHRAGVFAVAVSWGYTDAAALKDAKPDLLANKPEELLQLA